MIRKACLEAHLVVLMPVSQTDRIQSGPAASPSLDRQWVWWIHRQRRSGSESLLHRGLEGAGLGVRQFQNRSTVLPLPGCLCPSEPRFLHL